MILKCAERGEVESETQPIFVCHHCGMPVCGTCGTVLDDDDFDDSEEPLGRAAVHCTTHARYHYRREGRRPGAGAASSS